MLSRSSVDQVISHETTPTKSAVATAAVTAGAPFGGGHGPGAMQQNYASARHDHYEIAVVPAAIKSPNNVVCMSAGSHRRALRSSTGGSLSAEFAGEQHAADCGKALQKEPDGCAEDEVRPAHDLVPVCPKRVQKLCSVSRPDGMRKLGNLA